MSLKHHAMSLAQEYVIFSVEFKQAGALGFPQINSSQKSVLASIFVLQEGRNVKINCVYESF